MQIRVATADDLQLVADLRVAFLADVHDLDPEGIDAAFRHETATFLATAFGSGGLRSWLAEGDGRVLGLVSLLLQDAPPRLHDRRTREGYIINMFVEPAARRRGVGDALFRACLDAADELGVRRFYLRATDDGRPLYTRAGFAPTDGSWMDLPVPPPA